MKRLIDYFDRGAFCYPEHTCIMGAGASMTYTEMSKSTHALGHVLRDRGLAKDKVMSILSPNCSEILIAQLAGFRVGLKWSNLNARNAVNSNIAILDQNKVDVLFFHSSMAETAAEMMAAVPSINQMIVLDGASGDWPVLLDLVNENLHRGDVPYEFFGDDYTVLHAHTGGTTGAPKITEQTSRMLTAMMTIFGTILKFEEPPVNLVVAPLTHASGPIALAHMAFGGNNIILDHVDPKEILRSVEEHKVTTLFLPPTVTYMLLADPDFDKYDLSSLKYLVSTAAPIAPDRLKEIVHRIGPIVINIYGQTESGFPLTCLTGKEIEEAANNPELEHRLASCGRPTFFTQVAILDDDGNELGVGEIGEISTRGENLIKGFLDDPEATAAIRAKNGWQRTTDVGYRDKHGFIYISDRKKDMIISGGFNLYPTEIEEALMTHDAVQECVVIGVPDAKWGEAVKAVIKLKDGKIVEAEELSNLCRELVGAMKTPKSFEFWDELPKSPVGKVLKRIVRDKFWADKKTNVN